MRVAVTASRTVGPAVVRNRARRRVREAFRLAIASGAPSIASDILVAVRPEAKDADFQLTVAEAGSVLRSVAQ